VSISCGGECVGLWQRVRDGCLCVCYGVISGRCMCVYVWCVCACVCECMCVVFEERVDMERARWRLDVEKALHVT